MSWDSFDKKFPVIVSSLKNTRRLKRFAHAYLICGDNPASRQDFAMYITQIALCLSPLHDGSPCGKCNSCRQILNNTYPELYILAPSSKSRIIPVGDDENEPDTVRWFDNRFYLTSVTEAGKKVGIILDADRMQPSSQNAFLKTLEEPPQGTLLILVTGNPSELLPTIRSRCQNLMLLENSCSYDFKGCRELLGALCALQFQAQSLSEAEKCASQIIAVSDRLYDAAKETITAEWQKRLDMAKEDLEAPARKRLTERYEAAIESEYLRERTYFLSAVHTWFAQIYICKSSGRAPSDLSNPEIFEGLALNLDKISEKQALKSLEAAEQLLQNLKWNVDEDLALRTFALSAAAIN